MSVTAIGLFVPQLKYNASGAVEETGKKEEKKRRNLSVAAA